MPSILESATGTRLLPMYAHLCPSCHDLNWSKVWTNSNDERPCDICRSGIAAVAKYRVCSFITCRRHWDDAQKIMALARAVVTLDGIEGA